MDVIVLCVEFVVIKDDSPVPVSMNEDLSRENAVILPRITRLYDFRRIRDVVLNPVSRP
jgi:hypothetical protein